MPRTYPSSKPQSVEPTTSITSPACIFKCPGVLLVYDSMQTTVVLGWPIEHAALSEFVPTPDESLMMSLVSPMLLSKFCRWEVNDMAKLVSRMTCMWCVWWSECGAIVKFANNFQFPFKFFILFRFRRRPRRFFSFSLGVSTNSNVAEAKASVQHQFCRKHFIHIWAKLQHTQRQHVNKYIWNMYHTTSSTYAMANDAYQIFIFTFVCNTVEDNQF